MPNRGDPKIHSRTWSKADTSKQREKGWGAGSMTHLRMKGHFSLNYQEGKKKNVSTQLDQELSTKKIFLSQTSFLEAVNFILQQPFISY